MHGPEAVTSRRAKPYIDARRVKPNLGDGHDPRPAFSECREGRAGRRLEVDDPIINRDFSHSFL
jgi:hypothetical protein